MINKNALHYVMRCSTRILLIIIGLSICQAYISNSKSYSQTKYPVTELRFSYDYQSGAFIRRISGTVKNPQGLWDALQPLQPPPGARGDYGLIGDDAKLGKEPGYGLRQLGQVARRFITFEKFYVIQPQGFIWIGVQPGTFTSARELNDTSLGWVFFDVRAKFEADLKRLLY
jgi:hypothetical protein